MPVLKTVDKYGRRSTRARTSIPLEDPVVPDDGPLTFYPNGAANEPSGRGRESRQLNRLLSRLGGLGRNHVLGRTLSGWTGVVGRVG